MIQVVCLLCKRSQRDHVEDHGEDHGEIYDKQQSSNPNRVIFHSATLFAELCAPLDLNERVTSHQRTAARHPRT